MFISPPPRSNGQYFLCLFSVSVSSMLTSNVENPPPVQNNNDTDTDHDEDPDIAEMERMMALQEEHDREDEDSVHLRRSRSL